MKLTLTVEEVAQLLMWAVDTRKLVPEGYTVACLESIRKQPYVFELKKREESKDG